MNVFVAGIVTYNPDLKRLEENIKNIFLQVKQIIIVDNHSTHLDEIKLLCKKYKNIILIKNYKNMGIAYALNQIMKYAESMDYQWVVTLDQDSICPNNLLIEYEKYIDEGIGIICPEVQDKRRKYQNIKPKKGFSEIDTCITSASCTNIRSWRQVGGFDNKLFIDLVDNDFCKKIRIFNYKIIKLNYLVLNQEFGDIIPKDTYFAKICIKLSEILHNENIGKLSYKKKVNSLRVYYTCRNILYLNKKYKNYGKIGYKENYHCHGFLGFIVCFILPSILRAENKIEVFKAVINGINKGRILAKETKSWVK